MTATYDEAAMGDLPPGTDPVIGQFTVTPTPKVRRTGQGSRGKGQGLIFVRVKGQGSRVKGQGSRLMGHGSWVKDQGLLVRVKGYG